MFHIQRQHGPCEATTAIGQRTCRGSVWARPLLHSVTGLGEPCSWQAASSARTSGTTLSWVCECCRLDGSESEQLFDTRDFSFSEGLRSVNTVDFRITASQISRIKITDRVATGCCSTMRWCRLQLQVRPLAAAAVYAACRVPLATRVGDRYCIQVS